jgi:multiple antibiotic resistance protein
VFDTFLLTFIPLFVAFDALGLLPIYIKFTSSLDQAQKRRHLRDSLITALVTALLFVFIGSTLLSYLGITMKDFLVAGGIVIFITALKDIVSVKTEPVETPEMFGVVPLGIPLLAGPAVLATSAILWNQYPPAYYLISLLLNIIICGLVLSFSEVVLNLLGKRLIEALSKVASLIIASIAVMFVRKGLGYGE